jgi:beta-glucanase (GH16 family)
MRIMKTSSVRPRLCQFKWWVVAPALVVVLSLNAAAQTNILANPGFEAGNLNGWTAFGPNNSVLNTGGYAHNGAYYYKVYGQFNSSINYTGIYQDNPATPGNTYSADGWTYSLGSDGGGIHGQTLIWIEVSFRDSSYNTLALYRSTVVYGPLLSSLGGLNNWIDLQVTNQCSYTNASDVILLPGTVTNTVSALVAPPGTAYVRYQVVYRQGPDNANGSMYFDDLMLQNGTNPPSPVLQTNIVWSDEFNQPDNSLPDLTKWGYDLGGGGFGNNELETYTMTNARILGGQLVIETDRYLSGGKTNYTSTRMNTKGKWSWTYGRMEARIKIPRGQGIWPAFWMLGSNIDSVHWPTCGEIDIMENIGKTSDQGTDHGTIHGPQGGGDYNGGVGVGGTYTLPGGAALADAFHIYAIEWAPNQIKWYLDNIQFFTATPASLPGGSTWVFTQPQFFVLNVAVGGNWPGNPDSTTVFPQQMMVDYVRVYQQTLALAISVTPQPDGSFTLSWPNNIVCHLQAQTNSISGGTWSDLPVTTSPYIVTPDPTQTAVFYRLVSP